MYNLYKEYLESEETDLEYFDWLDNQILLRSRDRKIKEANQKAEKEKKKAEEANQRAEKVNNEIDSILDEIKESIIKYIKMQFHEDISDFISTFSKQQIRNLQKHLYDFEEFEELKNWVCQEKCVSNLKLTKK
ncbi:MAG: hypothetical protein EGR78_10095 [Erysipelotrichaceae bacterium]|nr:hypothetical protein [Erysipelotrichaceae bacterium]